jgi:alkylated DNA repair dioxygenase AlkB
MYTRNQVSKKSSALKKPVTTPTGGATASKEERGCVSAGNTPLNSPTIERKVMSRMKNITKRDSFSDLIDVTYDDFEKEGGGPCNSPLSGSNTCPCFQPPVKGSVDITCQKCQQKWHTTCHNLTGLTGSAAKKVMDAGWKCMRCYVSPYSDDQESVRNFREFQRITSDMERFNEELKKNFDTVEFFNLHLRRLMIDKEDYIKDSDRISQLEESVKSIQSLLFTCFTGQSSKTESSLPLNFAQEIEDLKGTVKSIAELLIEDHNSEVTARASIEVNEIKSAIDRVSSCSSTSLESFGNSIKQDIAELKSTFSRDIKVEPGTGESSNESFRNLDDVIVSIEEQLKNINLHVCPARPVEPIALHLEAEETSVTTEGSPSLAMTPNTTSPHYIAPRQESVPLCEPYLNYVEDAVPTETRNKVLQFLEENTEEFTSLGNRDVLYFGEYDYHYTGKKHEAKQTPLVIQELLDYIRPHLTKRNTWLNSCLITRYKDRESHIPKHSDNEASIDPESVIVTASFGAERKIKFTCPRSDEEKCLLLKENSVYTMTRDSQDYWQHEIPPLSASDQQVESSDNVVRYSFTFRNISPHYVNSTVIVGDSNTKYIKFGKGIGTLGKWVPGKRLRAAKIQDIPPANEIGPYRNIIIHTGINDLTDDFNRPSNRHLIGQLRAKCSDIHETHPHAKIFISLLLPTKSRMVNNRVTQLNGLILDMVFGRKNMFIIDNSLLSTENGCLSSKYGHFIGSNTPNANDIVHLGREGIKLLCMNMKKVIMSRGQNQSRERFQAGRGNYNSALGRTQRG